MSHLYLIDGSGYIFRAYYAIPPLSNSHGLPTNALLGFTQMLRKLEKEAKPEYWAIVFDSKEPTFRDALYRDYKANRKEPPDDLIPQFDYFPKITDALNIPRLVRPGFEADDIIATFTRRAEDLGFSVTIISGDKDLLQLLKPGVTMWDTLKEKRYDTAEAARRFGVSPEKIPDLFGLSGDSTDNIPGVPGIGPKTARKLIEEYGSLENLLTNAGEISGKTGKSLQEHADQARLSKKLAELHTDVPLPFKPEELRHRPPDTEACHKLFRELEFSRLLAELAPRESLSKKGYRLIQDRSTLESLAGQIARDKKPLSLDLETDSLDVMRAHIVGLSLSWEKGEAAYIPVRHSGLKEGEQLSWETVRAVLEPVFQDPAIPKIGQNIKFDLAILTRHGIRTAGIDCDTMIVSYLLNPQGSHNLDDLSQQYLDHRTLRYAEVVGKGKTFAEVPLPQARDYAAEDADCARQLADILLPKLEAEGLMSLFRELEMPLTEVLLKMEMRGVRVDAERLKKLSGNFEGELQRLEKEIHGLAGAVFNIQSPKQLGEVLFGQMGIPGGKKTKTGFSTAQDILEGIAPKHPIAEKILEYRSLAKLKSTYTDALLGLIHPETGRIHTSFNQTVAATGRLSSSDPNLQNIPIRSPEGRKIREAFIADDGFQLLSADYSQIELRLLAHYCGDERLLNAFRENADVHAQTAAALFATEQSQLTPSMRAVGKTVNFAIIYGQTPFGLSRQLGMEIGEAARVIENYFRQYPKVGPFREKILAEARERGYVKTLLGRRRFAPDLASKNPNIRANAERMAFNTIFQGSAADIIKKAMIEIEREIGDISPRTRMILQVHDELLFEIPEGETGTVTEWVRQKMESAYALAVPLVVDCGCGPHWAVAH